MKKNNASSTGSSTSLVGTVCTILFIILLVLKLTGLATLTWLAVFTPLFVEVAYLILVVTAYVGFSLAMKGRWRR